MGSGIENIKIEVCIDSVESAINAEAGGAERVELCANLLEGGTTASSGMIASVRDKISIGLQVMIRPRGADFLYSEEEFEVMKYDIGVAKDLGADGVVFGCLLPAGAVDMKRMAELIECSRPMSVTFHRAFDMVNDPFEALENLVSLGVDRILTSGLERTALEGADLISELVRLAGDRIIILAGGGVRPYNIRKLIAKSHVKECHVSGRKSLESGMIFRNGRVSMGGTFQPPEFSTSVVDPEVIRSFL